MKIAFFGGTFDPVHLGHTGLASAILEHGYADEVLFVPAFIPPHKSGNTITPYEKRRKMLELATGNTPGFRISDLEKERGGLSFTADSLNFLSQKYDSGCILLLIGSDSLQQLHSWYRAHELLQCYPFLVYPRNGRIPREEELRKHWTAQETALMMNAIIDIPERFPGASADLRQLFAEGRIDEAAPLLNQDVYKYILEHNLYRRP